MRTLRLLLVEAPPAAHPSPNAAALHELLSRIGLRTGWVDIADTHDGAMRASLVLTAARGADFVVVVGNSVDLDIVRDGLAGVELHVHSVDLQLADAKVADLAAEGIWPLGRMVLDGAPLAA